MTESIAIILILLWQFRKCFLRMAAFQKFVGFIFAYLLASQRMTITGIYRFLGSNDHLSNYHRFLSRSPWKPEDIFRQLFFLILSLVFVLQDEEDQKCLILIIDSTLIEKSGDKTDGVGMHHSSTHGKTKKGNEAVRLSILLKIPGIGILEFPFMCQLYITEKSIRKHQLETVYWTREAMAARMVKVVRSWCDLPILLIGDALYSTETTINPLRKIPNVHLISRRRNGEKHSGVVWKAFSSPEKKRGRGRPRKKGKEIRFNDIPEENFRPCKYFHREKEYTIKVVRLDNVLVRKCPDPVSIIVAIGKDGKRFALISTDMSLSTVKIFQLYRLRFNIEFGFRDTKQFTGFGDYQVRGLVSIVKHLTLSQTAYSLGKMVFVLCQDLRQRSSALFYIKDRRKASTFSMMSLKEEMRSDFLAWLLGKPDKQRLDYVSLIFNHNSFLPLSAKKIPLKWEKKDEIAD